MTPGATGAHQVRPARHVAASDVEAFKRGMQSLAGHVTVLTTRDTDGSPVGITATAVCSLTAEPPSLLASINRSTWLGAVLDRSGAFGVNILSHEQVQVARVFAGMDPSRRGSGRFDVGSWTDGVNGSPLLDDALASFDCTLDDLVVRSTHLVAFGLIAESRVLEQAADPLIYHRRLFGTMAAVG
jgi:flavin reductase (DIM6/NTAB) family NADH-FMN oxidoreductase RutF